MSVNQIAKKNWVWLVSGVFPILIFFIAYPHYIRENMFFWVCILSLPLSVQTLENRKESQLFFTLALVCAIVTLLLPTVIGIYCFLCLTIIFLIQNYTGGATLTLLIHMLLASPLFLYFKSLISFPIRLELSEIVYFILNNAGFNIKIEGNLIHTDTASFLIDEACSGLYLLGYGLLFGTIILSHFSKNHPISLTRLIFYYIILLLLILVGNIVRIAGLIVFEIMPEHWLHETIGILIYAFQILIPFYLIVKYSFGRPHAPISRTKNKKYPTFKYGVLTVLFLTMIARDQSSNKYEVKNEEIKTGKYTSKLLKNGVVKLQNEISLIYIKSPIAPYKADHNPIVCWKGSGYKFKKIEKKSFFGTQINIAELEKGNEKLYTSWWFESGKSRFGSQLDWRINALKTGERFYLINATFETREKLIEELSHFDKIIFSTD